MLARVRRADGLHLTQYEVHSWRSPLSSLGTEGGEWVDLMSTEYIQERVPNSGKFKFQGCMNSSRKPTNPNFAKTLAITMNSEYLPMVSHIFNRPEDLSADVARGKVDGDGRLGHRHLRLSGSADGRVVSVVSVASVVRPLVDEQVVVLREGPLAEATRERRRRRDERDDEGGRGLRAALPPRGRVSRRRLELLDGRVDRKHLHQSRGVPPLPSPRPPQPAPLFSSLLCFSFCGCTFEIN